MKRAAVNTSTSAGRGHSSTNAGPGNEVEILASYIGLTVSFIMVTKKVMDSLSQQYFCFGDDHARINIEGCTGAAFDFHNHIHTVIGMPVMGTNV